MPLLSRLCLQPDGSRVVVKYVNEDCTFFLKAPVYVAPVFFLIISLPAVLLFSRVSVRAQPAFYVEIAARELIDIMKFGDRLLPMVAKSMIPTIVQKRGDVEHDDGA